jgi:hypothetical protein
MNCSLSLSSCALLLVLVAACRTERPPAPPLPVGIGLGISRIQDSVCKFDLATHSAVDAEASLIKAEQIIDIDSQFYSDAFDFATHQKNTFDLAANYEPRQITAQQAATRKALMDAVGLYADKLQALATGEDDSTLDSNSTSLAQSLVRLGTAGRITLTPGNRSIATDVAAAVDAVARFALDSTRAKDLKFAAMGIDVQLEVVVRALEGENLLLGKNIGNDLGGIEADLFAVAHLARDSQPRDSTVAPTSSQEAQAFFAVVAGRQLLHADLAIVPATGTGGAKAGIDYNAIDFSKSANEALEAVLTGNRAIANAGAAGIYSAATDIAQRAKAAQTFANSLSSGK